MTSAVREYETVFILDPGLEEAKEKEEVDRATKLIKDLDGTVDETERWGRRRLAYEIQKKRDGIYNILRYHAPSTTVKELERRLRINEKVLRVLTVVIDPKQKKAMLEMQAAEKAAAEAAAAAMAAIPVTSSSSESPAPAGAATAAPAKAAADAPAKAAAAAPAEAAAADAPAKAATAAPAKAPADDVKVAGDEQSG